MTRRNHRPGTSGHEAAQVFKALGHPERVRLVRALAAGPQCVRRLHDAHVCDLSTLSRHLGVLKAAGVVEAHRRGREIEYTLKLRCAADFLMCLDRQAGPACACATR